MSGRRVEADIGELVERSRQGDRAAFGEPRDRFDPRRLAAGQSDPLDALRAFVARLLAAGGGIPLPDAASAAGRPVRVFPELAVYHSEVLRRAAHKLA